MKDWIYPSGWDVRWQRATYLAQFGVPLAHDPLEFGPLEDIIRNHDFACERGLKAGKNEGLPSYFRPVVLDVCRLI